MSRSSNSEKYAVCIGFKCDEKHKDYKSIDKELSTLLETLHKNQTQKLVGVSPDYVLSTEFENTMTNLNRTIANYQCKSINEIMAYVNKEVYSGDEYHERRDQQIEGSAYWINLFFPELDGLTKSEKNYKTVIEKSTKKSKLDTTNMGSKLVPLAMQKVG